MPDQHLAAHPALQRRAVVDLGSNSVRLVVFEGLGRNPVIIFNEKATLRLGRGLQTTGRLNEAGVAAALVVMGRYAAVANAMGAHPFEVLATAAVRDAANGKEFVAGLKERMPGCTIRILSGEEEAALSAAGLRCGIPEADGLLADIGGGSLELVRLDRTGVLDATSLRLGVIRLADRSEGNLERADAIAEADLAAIPWLNRAAGRDLYLVGGAWRALARAHMQATSYPLGIVHHYIIDREATRAMTALVLDPKRTAGARPKPSRRSEDLPYAALIIRRLLRLSGARRLVFSANGIREGWFMQAVPEAVRAEDPLLAAAQELAGKFARDPALPAALIEWTAPLFPAETRHELRLRQAACWMSDIGSHDHPEYRAQQSFDRAFWQPGVGLDHPTRAFLALVLAHRYDAPPDAAFAAPARALADANALAAAATLGAALRLAYFLSAGMPSLLAGAILRREPGRLRLSLGGSAAFDGDGVQRRLDRLAQLMGLPAFVG